MLNPEQAAATLDWIRRRSRGGEWLHAFFATLYYNVSCGRSPAGRRTSRSSPLRREIQSLVRHCTADSATPIWRMIDESPALREYEESMRVRHAESPATAVAADPDLPQTTTASRTIARFVIDVYSLAREAPSPDVALDEIFRMIEAAWAVTCPSSNSTSTAGL